MAKYLRAKFEVSSKILTRFRQEREGGNLPPPPPHHPPQNKLLKSPPRLRLSNFTIKLLVVTYLGNIFENG